MEIVKFEVVVGEGEGEDEGVGEGEEVDKIKDQVLLQSLHVPLWSLAITRQYQVPFVKTGV